MTEKKTNTREEAAESCGRKQDPAHNTDLQTDGEKGDLGWLSCLVTNI